MRQKAPFLVPVCFLAVMLSSCSPVVGHRNPQFADALAPKPTLLVRAVSCLESKEMASGGQRVRRVAGFGAITLQQVNQKLERMGVTAAALPKELCRGFTSAEATHGGDFNQPSAPKQVARLLSLTDAKSLLLTFVRSRLQCERDSTRWRWGEASYTDTGGRVDCHERELMLASYLYDSAGVLRWKGLRQVEVTEPPEANELVNELFATVPIDETIRAD